VARTTNSVAATSPAAANGGQTPLGSHGESTPSRDFLSGDRPVPGLRWGVRQRFRSGAADCPQMSRLSTALSAQDLAVDQPGVGKPVLPPAVTMEAAGSPKFPWNSRDHSPCSSDPGETSPAEWAMSQLPGAVPASDNNEDSPRELISGLNHKAFDLAVDASRWK
jgi:hypothetical protein